MANTCVILDSISIVLEQLLSVEWEIGPSPCVVELVVFAECQWDAREMPSDMSTSLGVVARSESANSPLIENTIGDDVQRLSRELFYLLALQTTGFAGREVRQHANGEGFSLWQSVISSMCPPRVLRGK
eukprot:4195534-Amphidinium_carterae.1